MYLIIKTVCKLITSIFYRVKLVGKENIPEEGSAIICPNHVHAFDSVSMVAHNKRKISVLAKEELFKSKLNRWLAKTCYVYPIKQNRADIEAIKVSLKVLKSGQLLMIFPEGTRNGLAKGIPVKNGAIILAIKSGAPIIPVGIKGEFKPFRKVVINIGKPIYYNEYKSEIQNKEIITNLTNDLMNEIIKLRDL